MGRERKINGGILVKDENGDEQGNGKAGKENGLRTPSS